MILEEFDDTKEAILDPGFCVEKNEDFPEITIACFSSILFDRILESFKDFNIIGEVHSADDITFVYEITYKKHRFAIFKAPVGEPRCVSCYETILAMGSKCLILFGNCGVLDKNIEDCGIIIPTLAIRDEGCSYHYAAPSRTIDVNLEYKDLFKEVLKDFGYNYIEGTTWTTDAPYRETRKKAIERKNEGAICVEMECAGMQALCNFRDTSFFQFLYAGDNLDGDNWDARSLSGFAKLDTKIKIALLAFELGLKIMKQKKV